MRQRLSLNHGTAYEHLPMLSPTNRLVTTQSSNAQIRNEVLISTILLHRNSSVGSKKTNEAADPSEKQFLTRNDSINFIANIQSEEASLPSTADDQKQPLLPTAAKQKSKLVVTTLP